MTQKYALERFWVAVEYRLKGDKMVLNKYFLINKAVHIVQDIVSSRKEMRGKDFFYFIYCMLMYMK